MSSHRPRLAIALFVALTAIACSLDAPPTSPAKSAVRSTRPDLVSGLASSLESLVDTTITSIVVDPTQTATYTIGGVHQLFVRGGGMCDLSSTYGVLSWDLPCLPATSPVLITAKSWYDPGGHPHIDFSPQLRFVPNDTAASARLFLYDWIGAYDRGSVIDYCNDAGCVDESVTDSSLVTRHDTATGYVSRRIKHFSGYEVAAGRADSTSTQ